MRLATRKVVDEMLSSGEYHDVMNSWTKIIPYYPINDEKAHGLFSFQYHKNYKTNHEKI